MRIALREIMPKDAVETAKINNPYNGCGSENDSFKAKLDKLKALINKGYIFKSKESNALNSTLDELAKKSQGLTKDDLNEINRAIEAINSKAENLANNPNKFLKCFPNWVKDLVICVAPKLGCDDRRDLYNELKAIFESNKTEDPELAKCYLDILAIVCPDGKAVVNVGKKEGLSVFKNKGESLSDALFEAKQIIYANEPNAEEAKAYNNFFNSYLQQDSKNVFEKLKDEKKLDEKMLFKCLNFFLPNYKNEDSEKKDKKEYIQFEKLKAFYLPRKKESSNIIDIEIKKYNAMEWIDSIEKNNNFCEKTLLALFNKAPNDLKSKIEKNMKTFDITVDGKQLTFEENTVACFCTTVRDGFNGADCVKRQKVLTKALKSTLNLLEAEKVDSYVCDKNHKLEKISDDVNYKLELIFNEDGEITKNNLKLKAYKRQCEIVKEDCDCETTDPKTKTHKAEINCNLCFDSDKEGNTTLNKKHSTFHYEIFDNELPNKEDLYYQVIDKI